MKRWRPALSRPPPISINAVLGHYRNFAMQDLREAAALGRADNAGKLRIINKLTELSVWQQQENDKA